MNLDGLPFAEQAFLALTYAILALLGASVVFGVLTLLLRARSRRVARLWAVLEARWDPLILRVLEGTSDGTDLLKLVGPDEHLRFLDYLLSYARRIRGNEVRNLERMARPFLPLLVERTRGGGEERRARAVQTLAVLGMPAHAAVVRDALDDPSPLVSMIAAKGLVTSGLPEATSLILRRIDRYRDWHPAFLSGLLADAGAEAAPLLRSTLSHRDGPSWVGAVVAQALATLRDLESADVAARILSPSQPTNLLVACLDILAKVGEGRHREAVVHLLDHPDPAVRTHALEALRNVGSTVDWSRFSAALEDESPWVALEAARGLRSMGALEPLRALAASGSPRSSVASQVLFE